MFFDNHLVSRLGTFSLNGIFKIHTMQRVFRLRYLNKELAEFKVLS